MGLRKMSAMGGAQPKNGFNVYPSRGSMPSYKPSCGSHYQSNFVIVILLFVLSRFSNFTNPSAYGDAHIIHDSVGEGFPITLDRCFFDDSNQIPALSASAGDGAVLVQNTVGLEAEDVEHVNIVASCAMTDAFCDADFCTDIALGTSCT